MIKSVSTKGYLFFSGLFKAEGCDASLLTVLTGVVVVIPMYTQYLIYVEVVDVLFSGECLGLASPVLPEPQHCGVIVGGFNNIAFLDQERN
jgi:hypothetical protein